jgi:predicted nuclease of predicted toxin-antitoxin system
VGGRGKSILVTIDTDFGQLMYVNGARHRGIVRLPDVPVQKHIQLMEEVITRYRSQLETGQLITVRGIKSACQSQFIDI